MSRRIKLVSRYSLNAKRIGREFFVINTGRIIGIVSRPVPSHGSPVSRTTNPYNPAKKKKKNNVEITWVRTPPYIC